jgi:hypothetical protein
MTRMLPASALETIVRGRLDAFAEGSTGRWPPRCAGRPVRALEISEASYAKAYRAASSTAERERQIWLTGRIGTALDRLARKPLIAGALRLMEGPAHAAGLGALHDFLARGFAAFRGMRGADEFLAVIGGRETRINARLFAADPHAFDAESA